MSTNTGANHGAFLVMDNTYEHFAGLDFYGGKAPWGISFVYFIRLFHSSISFVYFIRLFKSHFLFCLGVGSHVCSSRFNILPNVEPEGLRSISATFLMALHTAA